MVSERDNGLLPLKREYNQVWHGFDRGQVLQYLDHVEMNLRRVMADRDAAMAQASTMSRELENARAEIRRLHMRVEELKKPPERVEDLDERMQRTVDLANSRAEEIVGRAEVAAEEWAKSTDVSSKLRVRYQKLIETLESHAKALDDEHRNALDATKNEVRKLTTEAAQRRTALDIEAERKRRTIEHDFDTTMASQRAALEKHVADQKTASKNQAERRIADATAEAKRLVDEATARAKRLVADATADAERREDEANRKVQRLNSLSDQALTRLRKANDVLTRSHSALTPLREESVVDLTGAAPIEPPTNPVAGKPVATFAPPTKVVQPIKASEPEQAKADTALPPTKPAHEPVEPASAKQK
ncbi:coiled-coil domain-containing protein [Amycolatopsis alkalitolerans]|uniref:Cell division protein DivIVA n=1 Tax=Amycolatopsis alkalitolerans TaxID=2547244 RepID=A0A5C4MDH8_9PSEU|nr:cell division protein DivIVA [Amycolatopsis alkalitolerans]TNC29593.1 cell division protein DivIVA [Amycolatopsis alkalitolerans]